VHTALKKVRQQSQARFMARCVCFRMCTLAEIQHVFEHMPLSIDGPASKWAPYFKSIYGSLFDAYGVVLPGLEVIYPDLLPIVPACSRMALHLPRCSDCTGWLEENKTRSVDPTRFFFSVLPHRWPGAFRRFVGFQRNDLPAPSNEWTEIVRVLNDGSFHKVQAEGGHYGCWMWPASGSGIFVNTRRTLFYSSRRAAGRNFSKLFNYTHHDATFANATRRFGYDSLQVLLGSAELFGRKFAHQLRELVVAYGECHSGRLVTGPCLPGVPLRTGWNASRACACDPQQPVINCNATQRDRQRPDERERAVTVTEPERRSL
jgi:hypothetical protein